MHLNHPALVGQRLIISDNQDEAGSPLLLDGEAIDGAAKDSLAIGQLMVDQVWAERADPTGGGLYYERNCQCHRRLRAFTVQPHRQKHFNLSTDPFVKRH
jgi:hypothetical protein